MLQFRSRSIFPNPPTRAVAARNPAQSVPAPLFSRNTSRRHSAERLAGADRSARQEERGSWLPRRLDGLVCRNHLCGELFDVPLPTEVRFEVKCIAGGNLD